MSGGQDPPDWANAQCPHSCVGVFQGLEFIADNKEEQSKTLLANVAAVNDELQGIVSSLHTGRLMPPISNLANKGTT